MSKIISARDLVPNLYQNDSENDSEPEEDEVDDLFYDIRHLTAADYHTVKLDSDSNESKDEFLLNLATTSTQYLINK